LIWTDIPLTLSLNEEQSQARWGFILAVADSLESAESWYDKGLTLMAGGSLRSSHEQAWKELWLQSKIEVVGSERLYQALIGCMFYLLSAFPSIHDTSSSFGGVSPGGLSNGGDGQDYWGHVFWDQDIWMYPGIALFYPKLARSVLEYRVRTIDGARDNAQRQGYKGLKYPWESAVSGREVCPEDIYGQQEIHINGDVSLAFQHYLYLTKDMSMFTEGQGSQVVWGVADYWVSRVTWSPEDHKYHILGVMPPDEYYYNVNNSVYTNAVAKLRNDLLAYEPVTDPNGPAMTWGMFAIGWLELDEAERAQHLLTKCFSNIQGPFQVWSESSDGSGAVNFLTGMGGFLQAVLFGYTGFRVQRDCLCFSPLLSSDISELCIRGVSYLGNQLDWLLRKEEMSIILRGSHSYQNVKSCNLQIVLKASGSKIPLTPGATPVYCCCGILACFVTLTGAFFFSLLVGLPVTFPREPGFICKLDLNSSCWPF
uniref:Protein-glucosylgalactosylhydroxylysine glucosidase n=1 Tax=Neogobius melanostomus TaxID=47308 RepID=A0A8C6WY21_9GOBI